MRAVLAAYSASDVAWSLLVFLLWIAFIAVCIWMLIFLFRNRDLPLMAKLGLALAVVLLPGVGVIVCLVVWFVMKSDGRGSTKPTPDR
jgi:hypothetical protein